MNDIDLSSYANWDPIDYFKGTLDGNGYIIRNLTIERYDDYVGFFSITFGSTIQNLGFENANIKGGSYVGGIAGQAANISNCYVTGDVTGNEVAGGLVGNNVKGGSISNSYASGIVIGYGVYIGGLVGMNYSANISNSFAFSEVTGNGEGVGGLVGCDFTGNISNSHAEGKVIGNGISTGGLIGILNGGTISNSYATGLVQGTTNVGGLVGLSESNAKIENSIWNTQTTGQNAAYGSDDGTGNFINNKGLTTAEMQNPANWSGWDSNIWDFSSYPPTFKMYTPVGGGGTGGAGDVPIPGAVRLQIGSDSSSTSAIYVDTSFDLGAFDVDFSSADTCAAAIEEIDEVLSRINTKRSEFGAVINRLSSILESQTTTIQNFTSAKSTIMDADIANESADFVKNQILQQTSSALLAQSQNLHASIVLSLIG